MATTCTISWKKADLAPDDELIAWVDVAKLDEGWRSSVRSTDALRYLAPGSGCSETFRYLRAAVAGDGRALMRMPRLAFLDPYRPKHRIDFIDGRHRFAFVRDHRGAAMPVAVAKEDFVRLIFLFGSEAKTCEIMV